MGGDIHSAEYADRHSALRELHFSQGVTVGRILVLGKNALDHIRGAFDDSQQGQRRPGRLPAFLFPFLDGAFRDVQHPGELALRNPELEAHSRRVGDMDGFQFLVLAAFDMAYAFQKLGFKVAAFLPGFKVFHIHGLWPCGRPPMWRASCFRRHSCHKRQSAKCGARVP